jgi:hypothetical protein
MEPNTQPTQSGERVSQGLNGVREKARKNKQERFTALLHGCPLGRMTVDLLRESYYGLERKAAPGVDGVTWRVWDRAGGSTQRSARPGPPRSVPGIALKEKVDTEGQREATPAGNCGAGRQDRPKRGGDGPQSDIRGRLSGLLLWVSTGTRPAYGARRALCGHPGDEGELDTGPEAQRDAELIH